MTASTKRGALCVSVVICAFTEQRWLDLTAAVDAVLRQSRRPDQVLLVIDHNNALLDRARSTWEPTVLVVASQGPPGLSGARNTGVACSTGDLIAFLDDDAIPEPGWLQHLTAPFEEPRVVAVGGTALPRWETSRPRWWPAEFDWVVGCTYLGLPAAGGEVRNVHGATMAFRADVFAGGESFSTSVGRVGASPTGCEETELCIRIRQRRPDASILLEPRAVVHHRVTPARERFSYFARRTFAEGRSKATVARLVGARDALSTERSYVARTLPAGVVNGLVATCRGDLSGAARAGAISIGLLSTAAGYALGRAGSVRRSPTPDERAFLPVRLMQLELHDPASPTPDPAYSRGRVLVRRDGRPVGTVDVLLDEGRISPVDEARIRASFPAATPSSQPVDDRFEQAPEAGMSVVIATHDRPLELRRCLDSLLASQHPDLQIVVVDNAPSSSVTEQMLEREYPTVTYLREDVAGLARAHNRGLQHVSAPVVAFTDDDVVVDRDWLRNLAAHFSCEQVGCVTGLILPAELETPTQAVIEAHGRFGKGFATRTFNLSGSRPDDPLFPYTAGALGSGANMAFRTDVLRGLGGFDPALGAGSRGRGGDDLAAFLDVVEAGHTLVYEPSAIVHHHHRRELGDARAQALNYGVGLAAYLTRAVIRRPSRLVTFARLAPRAVLHLASASTSADPESGAARTSTLLFWQLLGLARGPIDYARSVHEASRAPVEWAS